MYKCTQHLPDKAHIHGPAWSAVPRARMRRHHGGWRRPRSLKGEEQGVSMRFGIHEIARTTSPPSIASANVRLELHVLDHARSHR